MSRSNVDLRPLSIGDILDRTFLLYRSYFLLFLGITAMPELFITAWNLALIPLQPTTPASVFAERNLAIVFLSLILSMTAYLFSQGGSVLAVSDLYLGRSTSISGSLKRVWKDFGSLAGVLLLNGLAVGLGYILLIVPGIYLTCRLLICVPAALIENRGPRESLERAFHLTRDDAGRAFLILALSVVLTYAAGGLLVLPFTLSMAAVAREPNMLRLYQALTQVSGAIADILVQPVGLIATSIFYYDLRVRKEALDLEFMMNPDAPRAPRLTGPPSILS